MNNPFGINRHLLIFLVIPLGLSIVGLVLKNFQQDEVTISNELSDKQEQSQNTPTQANNRAQNLDASPNQDNSDTPKDAILVQDDPDVWSSCASAWLYAGNCDAKDTYSNNQIHTLKAQWAKIDPSGTLEMWDSASFNGCGYDEATAKDVAAHSSEQFLTIVSHCDDLAGFRKLIASKSLIENFTEQTLAYLRTTGWTGIDIDFECFHSWTSGDMKNYAAFLGLYANALNDAGYKVNVALIPKLYDSDSPKNLDFEALADIPVHEWEMMSYDYAYAYGLQTYTPVQDLQWAGDVYNYAAEIFDPSKISMGIPSYGYYMQCGVTPPIPTYFNGNEAKSLKGYSTGKYDQSSGEYTWTDGENCYWYSDQKSLDTKRQYLESKGVQKVSIWSIGGGNEWFGKSEGNACLTR